MKKLLNTLYITNDNTYLSKEGETVLVKVNRQAKHKFPIHLLQSIVCFGDVGCSPALMSFCSSKNVSISFLSINGRFLAKVRGPVSGNVLLRRQQYRFADDPLQTEKIARSCILGKLVNSRTVLMRAAREHPIIVSREILSGAARHIGRLVNNLEAQSGVDSLRGLEGESAKVYFSVFNHLILSQKDEFFFKLRSRRPPLDKMNALLSFIYTLVGNDVASALEVVGLDPAVGFLHRDRPGRPGLALDMLEEYRAFIADRLVLTLVNRRQISGKGFIHSESGDVRMNDETRKEILMAFQKRKQDEIMHPFLGEKIPIGLIPYIQALLLSRYIRGDIDAYPPFVFK